MPTEGLVTKSGYLLGNEWELARQRLGLLEDAFDVNSMRYLNDLGVSDGWQCLEVGAGGGSIVGWLCRQVGPGGRVVATDLDNAFSGRAGSSPISRSDATISWQKIFPTPCSTWFTHVRCCATYPSGNRHSTVCLARCGRADGYWSRNLTMSA